MTTDANFVVKKGLNVQDGDISIKGSNKELRFYEGSNYVGFEAPALSADKIWVLPSADGSTGQVLKTDGSGNLGWVSGGDTNAGGVNGSAGSPTFSFSNDSDTGFYLDGTNTIGVSMGGSRKFRMYADTFRMDGTTNPQVIKCDSASVDLELRSGGSTYGKIHIGRENQDIEITPAGTGQVAIGNFKFDTDQSVGSGQDNYVLTYDHANTQISLEAAASGGISNVVEDTSPQLGGDLDVNGNELVSTSNANIGITPNGTGKVIIGSTTSQHDGLSKLTIKGSDAGMLIEKHDDGSSGGPTLSLYRYSASVADSDLIGQVNFRGEGSTGNPSTYISLRTQIEDTTEGTKDGKLIVRGLKANSQTDFMSVGSSGVEFEGGAKVGVVTDVTIGSGTSGTTTGFRLGANQEAGMVAGEVSSQSTANDGYIELMNMDLDAITGASGLQTIELTVQIEDETNQEVESFKALVQATEKTVLGTTARAVNFTEWAILYDGAARIGTLAADYDSSDDTIRIRYQNKQGSTATLTATFYAITMQNNT